MITPNTNFIDKAVVIIGLGNIGSQVVPLIVRRPEVRTIILVDPDFYCDENLLSQNIAPGDVGRAKVEVQADRLRRVRPGLVVKTHVDLFQNVPLGELRGDVILSCVDSRSARRDISRAAFRLGVALVDAGVDAGNLYARVNIYLPGGDLPCIECSWGEDDYANLDVDYSCESGADGDVAQPATTSTRAPATLGAFAASIQVTECQRLLSGRGAGRENGPRAGLQVLHDLDFHRQFTTRHERQPTCRFDHCTWDIESLPVALGTTTVEGFLQALPHNGRAGSRLALGMEGFRFARSLRCGPCQYTNPVCVLTGRSSTAGESCPRCGQRLVAPGFDRLDWLLEGHLNGASRMTLEAIGFRTGDVVTVSDGSTITHYELQAPNH